MDTGVGELDGHRFRRVAAAIKAGTLKPSMRAIHEAEGGSKPVITAWLQEMVRTGDLVWTGTRYKLATEMQQLKQAA